MAQSASASASKSAASIGGKPASTTASSVLESARHLDADLEGLLSGGLGACSLVVLPDSSSEGPVTLIRQQLPYPIQCLHQLYGEIFKLALGVFASSRILNGLLWYLAWCSCGLCGRSCGSVYCGLTVLLVYSALLK